MSEFVPGLEGVIAFETEIAEPDKEGSSLRYRGVDIEDLVGRVSFLPHLGSACRRRVQPWSTSAQPFPIPVHSGDVRVDVQSAIAMLAPWGLHPLLDIDDQTARDNLANVSVMAMSFVAQAARGLGQPMVPESQIDQAKTIVERFMVRWRGDPDPKHVQAVDAPRFRRRTWHERVNLHFPSHCLHWCRRRCGHLRSNRRFASGPLHGGAPSRVLEVLN